MPEQRLAKKARCSTPMCEPQAKDSTRQNQMGDEPTSFQVANASRMVLLAADFDLCPMLILKQLILEMLKRDLLKQMT